MTAVNGFTIAVVFILFGGAIGSLVDRYQRISVIRLSLLIQNTTVALNCIIVICIMIFQEYLKSFANEWPIYGLQGIMIFFNCISALANMTTQVSLQRDWVVVIANDIAVKRGDQDEKASSMELTKINAQCRSIDLITNIVAPMFAGAVMSFANLSTRFNGIIISAIILATWNIISYFIESSLLISIYNSIPTLEKEQPILDEASKKTFWQELKKSSRIFVIYSGYMAYFKQGILCFPGLSLATVFMTVLSFDSITIGFSKSQKISESAISIIQAIGSLTGIFGTIAFPILHNRCKFSLKITGLIGSISQLSFLLICLVSIWMPGSPFDLYPGRTAPPSTIYVNITQNETDTSQMTNNNSIFNYFFLSPTHIYTSIIMLLVGTAFSRFGLWLFDLSINQIIQENVPEKDRGIVGGVQNSLNKVFDMLKYLLVIFLPNFSQYGYLVILSVIFVFIALVLFSIYVYYTSYIKDYREVPQIDDLKEQNEESKV